MRALRSTGNREREYACSFPGGCSSGQIMPCVIAGAHVDSVAPTGSVGRNAVVDDVI